MGMLKQIMTGSNSSTLIPSVEPTNTAYVNWKAKNYSTTTRKRVSSASTQSNTDYRKKYNHGQMWKYRKILRRSGKFVIS